MQYYPIQSLVLFHLHPPFWLDQCMTLLVSYLFLTFCILYWPLTLQCTLYSCLLLMNWCDSLVYLISLLLSYVSNIQTNIEMANSLRSSDRCILNMVQIVQRLSSWSFYRLSHSMSHHILNSLCLIYSITLSPSYVLFHPSYTTTLYMICIIDRIYINHHQCQVLFI